MMDGYILVENNCIKKGNKTQYEKIQYSIRPTAFNKQ
jgi:hypothetical protein